MKPVKNAWANLLIGDVREQLATLAAGSVQTCVTSPPYWGLRDYGVVGQLGSEARHDCAGWATGVRCGVCFICHMVEVFEGVRRVLRDDGTLWLNMGDSYSAHENQRKATDKPGPKQSTNNGSIGSPSRYAPGLKAKDLCGMPWRLALSLQAAGWYLRSEIIWHKPSPMPESVSDRPTRAHEQIFLLAKSSRYYFDAEAVREKTGSEVDPDEYAKLLDETPEAWYQRATNPFANGKSGNKTSGISPPGGRNIRTVWTIASEAFPGSHFATFPTRLVEPCIKAGTSERGCCSACRAPWRRVVEKERRATRPGENTKVGGTPNWVHVNDENRQEVLSERLAAEIIGNRDPERHVTESRTVGWEPGCKCEGAECVPCLVLDPFTGSGTTGLVARKFGRHFVGTELNPEYEAMAWKRMNAHPKPDLPTVKPSNGQQPLFV